MTTIVNDFSFQLTDTGLIIGDDAQVGVPFIDIGSVSGLDNAPYRVTKRDHEGVDGGFIDAEFETGRDITIDGTIYANGQPMEAYLDSLKANWAPSTTLMPLYFLNLENGIRMVRVKPLGVHYNWETLRRTGMANVSFSAYAEDPRIYTATQQTVTFNVNATVYSGFGFPLGFSFGFGGVVVTSDGQFVNNAGNRPTPMVMTIVGACVNPIIICDTTNSTLQFNLTMGVSDTLVIDTQYKTVTLNGANRRSTLQNPGWFFLQPGNNFVRFRSTSGTATMAMVYRAAWR
jgi:hypothetical protein